MRYTREYAATDRYVTMGPNEYFGYERDSYYNGYDDYNYDDNYNPHNSGLIKKEISKLSDISFNEDEVIWY